MIPHKHNISSSPSGVIASGRLHGLTNYEALFAQEKLAVLESSCSALPDTYRPKPHYAMIYVSDKLGYPSMRQLTITAATTIIKTLTTVKKLFIGVEKKRPLLR